jgi:excisionase family DNA binding protein
MNSNGENLRLLRLRAAARYLSVSPAVLRRLIQQGAIAHIELRKGAPWLVDVEDLNNWIRKNKINLY